MLKGFRTFLLRGNVIDLAVAVVIGTAFTAVVTAIVTDVITPLIAAIIGKPHFSALTFKLHGSVFPLGDLVNSLISFLAIAAVVYFLVVLPASKVTTYVNRKREATEQPCPECLSSIPVGAHRCKFCTAVVSAPGPR